MFTAKLIDIYPSRNGFTVGKRYEVIDFNDYMGTYTILNDKGQRKSLSWMRFEDQGHASAEYQLARLEAMLDQLPDGPPQW